MESRREKMERVFKILDRWPEIDRGKKIPTAEFVERRKKTWQAISQPPHNAGYTECQEFYGAITLESEQPLDRQVVTMLDVALRGRGNGWDDVVIPGFDFFVVEDTLGKFGETVENLTGFYNENIEEGPLAQGPPAQAPAPGKLPIRVQDLLLNDNLVQHFISSHRV